jgi:hypothetical protein
VAVGHEGDDGHRRQAEHRQHDQEPLHATVTR